MFSILFEKKGLCAHCSCTSLSELTFKTFIKNVVNFVIIWGFDFCQFRQLLITKVQLSFY